MRFMTGAQSSQLINTEQQAPPARRDTVPLVQSDTQLGVFADQSLLAATWPRIDIVATDAIFNSMIDEIVTGATNIQDTLTKAEDQLEALAPRQ